MDNLNNIDCGIQLGNTGSSACDFAPGIFKQYLAVPRGFAFSVANTASPEAFIAAVQAGLNADNPLNRFYWLGSAESYTIQGEAAVRQTGGLGNSREVRQATKGEELQIWAGINTYREQRLTFHGKQTQFDLLKFDDQYVMWGKKVTVGADQRLGGYRPADISFSNYMEPDGTNGAMYNVNITYVNANEMNTQFAAFKVGSDVFGASTGLISVDISATSTGPTNVTVTAKTAYAADLFLKYPDELAVVGAWDVVNALTKAAITITAVAKTGNGWSITIAATGTDPDNPGTGQDVLVSLKVPSALAALTIPVTGIVSDKQRVTLG